ncbi:hypothetical protein PtB15_4B845 [Puccinia triticina]|nr:hypothetical protein PtB15_4B845 [Puccinia triticina]
MDEELVDPILSAQQMDSDFLRTFSQPGSNTRGQGNTRGGRGGCLPGPIRSRETESVDPDNETRPSGANRKKLLWTGPMELLMLDLYVEEVHRGKRSDSGFQSASHWHVAQAIRNAFPEVGNLLDYTKVKSKLSQSFKKDYDAFTACKNASGFGWDETNCKVIALDDVWEKFLEVSYFLWSWACNNEADSVLKSHPRAQKFQGSPFPEYRKLEIIFGTSAATGDNSRLVSNCVAQLQARAAGILPSPDSSQNPNDEAPIIDNSPNPAKTTNRQTPSPSAYLYRSHTKKDSVAVAIEGLVSYLEASRKRVDRIEELEHALEASQNKSLQAFKIFWDDLSAQTFISIHDKELRSRWLDQQMDEIIN